eukprot:gb/GECG01011123.1/.p1 GENE.gb/GECG01011123.1/~~gb/GECG01011123.1/.p1  ORF type:complete len:512 (+),score=123.78 gb/GECG01011123.1/:1-1536(+)
MGTQNGEDDVGVIRPPPEIRAIVDKTAEFVARNGAEFEQKIAEKQQGNTKFNFLKESDPYHAYYVQQVELYRQGKQPQQQQQQPETDGKQEAESATEQKADATETQSSAGDTKKLSSKVALITPYLEAKKKIPGGSEAPEAPPSFQFMLDPPPGISPAKLETIKLTAQYTAVSGRSFLTELSSKEEGNQEFDFLRPNNQLFPFFTSLVEKYSSMVKGPKDLRDKVAHMAEHKFSVFEKSVWRAEHKRVEEQRKAAERAETEGEQLAMADIDWHDFVVVDTINFNDDDEGLPAPSSQPAPRQHQPDISAKPAAAAPQKDDDDGMDTDSDESEHDTEMKPVEDDDEKLNVVPEESYQPKVAQNRPNAPTIVHPQTGREIPVDNLNENMRIEFMDPKYREETQRALEKHKTTNYLGGEDVAENLQRLAARRSDIFGEETAKARARVPQEEGSSQSKVVWDGKIMSAQALQEAKRLAAQQQQQQEATQSSKVENQSTVVGPAPPPPAKRTKNENE